MGLERCTSASSRGTQAPCDTGETNPSLVKSPFTGTSIICSPRHSYRIQDLLPSGAEKISQHPSSRICGAGGGGVMAGLGPGGGGEGGPRDSGGGGPGPGGGGGLLREGGAWRKWVGAAEPRGDQLWWGGREKGNACPHDGETQ